MDSTLGDMLVKVVVFFLVQALVYLILSNSSNIFSKDIKRSNSFRPARSLSIRRMLALVSDFPPEGEPSPSTNSPSTKSPQSQATQSVFENNGDAYASGNHPAEKNLSAMYLNGLT